MGIKDRIRKMMLKQGRTDLAIRHAGGEDVSGSDASLAEIADIAKKVNIPRGTPTDKVAATVEKIAGPVVEKTLAPKLNSMSLAKQCGVAMRMIQMTGLQRFRSDFLRRFPEDLKEHLAKGLTKEEVADNYFGVPEFKHFWDTMQMTRDDFMALMD